MSKFRIFETAQFLDDIKKISPARRNKVEAKLRGFVYPQLRDQPFFGVNIRKLKGFKPETWRYRIGSYRFFYIVDEREKIVFLVSADTRQQSY